MYHQLITKQESSYLEKLPEWIKLSVDLTLEKLDKKLFQSANE